MPHPPKTTWILPLIGLLMWLPAMMSAAPEWRDGEYYDYGWFVPPAMAFLWFRRWRTFGDAQPPTPGSGWLPLLIALAIWFPWIVLLRVLGHVDPSWRLPMILLGWTAVLTSHSWIAIIHGWRTSVGFVWISLLGLSAIPWPSAFETWAVDRLTSSVIATVAEIFRAFGTPVDVIGDQLRLHDVTVAVTDGCSGVRSFQSFLMATWFFAELQKLRPSRVAALLAGACAAGFLVNTARTYALASIRFEHGPQAFDRAHDWLGLIAFLLSASIFYWMSGQLGAAPKRRVIKVRPSVILRK